MQTSGDELGELDTVFRSALNEAITLGQIAPQYTGLGLDTLYVIDKIARKHPYAPAELIAHAYETFGREHANVD